MALRPLVSRHVFRWSLCTLKVHFSPLLKTLVVSLRSDMDLADRQVYSEGSGLLPGQAWKATPNVASPSESHSAIAHLRSKRLVLPRPPAATRYLARLRHLGEESTC